CVVGWHPVGDSNPCCRRERAVLKRFCALFLRVYGLFWVRLGGDRWRKPTTNYNKFKPLQS
ncbi:MAG: hypothetical protein P8N58_04450, partial [Emcibacteraceae bacterium]|nr:hypothetical protein [Emcibacteraceae bacterium]